MFTTLVVNIGITTYERRVGRRLGSEILVADANHTSSDVFVSCGVIVGLAITRFTPYTWADPVIALFVAGAIVWAAWDVFKQAGETLSDTARIHVAEVCEVANNRRRVSSDVTPCVPEVRQGRSMSTCTSRSIRARP